MTDKPTSAKPHVVNGITFRCYRVGVMRYHWRSDDGRLLVTPTYGRSTYYAVVDGKPLEHNFRSLKNAMKAAVKAVSS